MNRLANEETSSEGRRPNRLAFMFWAPLVVAAVLGVFSGVGAFTFGYAKGWSYFSTNPEACVNCHIMQPQYDGWQKSSHHTAAVCVDCHLPHDFVPKYLAKAENGWRHGEKFTTQNFHEPIYLQKKGQRILQDNCERCHGPIVDDILGFGRPGMTDHPAYPGLERSKRMRCVHCHAEVGHGGPSGMGGPLSAAEVDQTRGASQATAP